MSTDEDRELIERLLVKKDRGHFKSAELRADGLHITEKVLVLRNPDGPEAADRLESLLARLSEMEAEIASLREKQKT